MYGQRPRQPFLQQPHQQQQHHQQHAAHFGLLTTVNRMAEAASHAANAANSDAAGAAADDEVGFASIISDIMRGFGDCVRPLDDTVALVERILLQQLRAILNALLEAADRRCGQPKPTRTDFEFLMRKNPIKLQRLQQHIRNLQRNMEVLRQARQGMQLPLSEDDLDTNGAQQPAAGSAAAEAADVEPRYDEEKVRRLFRADRISQQLNGEQYVRYNEARRTSFNCRSVPRIRVKLHRWLGTKHTLSNEVYTLLAYVAHETIAVIVDYAILTRLHSGNRSNEPVARVVSAKAAHTMLHLCPEVTQGRAMDGLQPVTVAEVNEAMRRVSQGAGRTLGMHRQLAGRHAMPILAF